MLRPHRTWLFALAVGLLVLAASLVAPSLRADAPDEEPLLRAASQSTDYYDQVLADSPYAYTTTWTMS